MRGYLGRILRLDLGRGALWDEPLHEDYARRYVGGSGLAARYLYDVLDADTDPLGPDNPLLFMTGPLVGDLDDLRRALQRQRALAPHRHLGRSQQRRLLRPRAALRRL